MDDELIVTGGPGSLPGSHRLEARPCGCVPAVAVLPTSLVRSLAKPGSRPQTAPAPRCAALSTVLGRSTRAACRTPFPIGSLLNWGNAVRIKHLDGFTSGYFHLTPNSVKVKVGDKVVAGTVIAQYDSTGRSSGPHLHPQVQADSANWSQSGSISFNSCQVPSWRVMA